MVTTLHPQGSILLRRHRIPTSFLSSLARAAHWQTCNARHRFFGWVVAVVMGVLCPRPINGLGLMDCPNDAPAHANGIHQTAKASGRFRNDADHVCVVRMAWK